MPKPNLQQLLRKWQRRLRLQDFDITARYATRQEMRSEGDIGNNRIRYSLGLSDIAILDPVDVADEHESFKNVELTLVHELLHLLLDPILSQNAYNPERLEHALMEQTIEKLAKGLLEI